MQRGHQQPGDVLCDYVDGQCFRSHPIFSVETSSLQLCLYYDDVEMCNPLGSSRTKNKLGAYNNISISIVIIWCHLMHGMCYNPIVLEKQSEVVVTWHIDYSTVGQLQLL